MGCSDSGSSDSGADTAADTGDETTQPLDWQTPPALATVGVELPVDPGAGLTLAAADLTHAFETISGGSATDGGTVRVVLDAADAEAGDQGFRLAAITDPDGRPVLQVTAATEVGAMYGLYTVAADVGVRYLHPRETFYPSDPDAALPLDRYDGSADTPDFDLRGFHEHTQHPIVTSDLLLRPGDADRRQMLTDHLRWLARNRQNVLYFHFLKTVDRAAWVPWFSEVTAEAADLGVGVGAMIGFVDAQQNAYQIVSDDAEHPDSGMPIPEDQQIRAALDELLASGLSYVGFQIGASEFTKPDDGAVLGWLQVAVDHLAAAWPGVQPFAWIHITCDLHADDGTPFYHLPLQSDAGLGAFLHTTMFYTLEHPAPVYSCDDFSHQADFLAQADGTRPVVFFPETAWWLGFDNNLPLFLPITGWSRAWDIQHSLAGHDVMGHVTFSSGREWTYWQYDHHLTRLTWDIEVSWSDYLDWIAPVYGASGADLTDVVDAWTQLQVEHLYDVDPLMMFYLAGELPQDEIGATAGILARRPKVSFQTVLAFTDDELTDWTYSDRTLLAEWGLAYATFVLTMPTVDPDATPQQQALFEELRVVMTVFVRRLQHTLALYDAVVAARDGDQAGAEQKLSEAKAYTAEVLQWFQEAEARYRHPIDLLARPKPESPTSYPYGYLSETSSAFFWTRRDDQAEALIAQVFDTTEEAWSATPESVLWSDADGATLLEPTDELAGAVIAGFIPRILFGLLPADGAAMTVLMAQDIDKSGLPDPTTELSFAGVISGDAWQGGASVMPLPVYDSVGAHLGTLTLVDATLTLASATGVATPSTATLAAEVVVATLTGVMTSVAGLDLDQANDLVAGIYGIEASELPAQLPLIFELALTEL